MWSVFVAKVFWSERSWGLLARVSVWSQATASAPFSQSSVMWFTHSSVLTESSLEREMWGEPAPEAAGAASCIKSGQGIPQTLCQLSKILLVATFQLESAGNGSAALLLHCTDKQPYWAEVGEALSTSHSETLEKQSSLSYAPISAVRIQLAAPVPSWILDLILSFSCGLSSSKSTRLAEMKDGPPVLRWFSVNAV